MYLIRGINNIGLFQSRKKTNKKICATIGNFDGFHLGHQEIIRSIKSISKKNNYETLVCFTEPHASEFFAEKSQSFNSPPRIFPWRCAGLCWPSLCPISAFIVCSSAVFGSTVTSEAVNI